MNKALTHWAEKKYVGENALFEKERSDAITFTEKYGVVAILSLAVFIAISGRLAKTFLTELSFLDGLSKTQFFLVEMLTLSVLIAGYMGLVTLYWHSRLSRYVREHVAKNIVTQ